MNARPRRAFTLFQLLVLLALLGLLFALLLPAIAKVRQAANRATSMNNLKQLAIACHAYHDTYGHLPSGNDGGHFSAAAKLLPFVEQDNLYKLIDFDKPMTDQANATVRATRIKVFLSPLDPITNVKKEHGATNYLFNAGSNYALADNDGLFYQDSKVRFADVTDGLSNTLMGGETLKGDGGTRAVDVRRQHVLLNKDALKNLKNDSGVQEFKDGKNIVGDRAASWMDGRFLQGTFTGTRPPNDPKPDVSCDGLGGLSGLRSLEGTVNVMMGDGSVRSVRQTIKLEIWQLLTSRNDGQPIPAID
jgi:type II secretory pathway pseudopilin PulG